MSSGLTRRTVLAGAATGLLAGQAGGATLTRTYMCEAFLDSIGINTHFAHRNTPYTDNFARCIEALDTLGIRHLRDDIVIGRTEPPPQFERIRALAARGYRFSLVFYDGLGLGPRTPPERVGDIAAWSGGGMEIAEGSNEPFIVKNRDTAPHISAEHQRSLYAAVRADPNLFAVKVAGPSYIYGNVAAAENLSAAVDYANVHAYPGMEHPETTGPGELAKFVAAARSVFGDAPVMVTENGYHTALATGSGHLPISEGMKARYIPRLLLWSFLSGIRRTYIYEFASSFGGADTDPESHFGLLAHDGTSTPAYDAVRNLVRLFSPYAARGPDRLLGVTVETGLDGLLTAGFARSDGATLVALWLGIGGWDPRVRRPKPDLPGRPVALRVSGVPRSVSLTSFQDDGSVQETSLIPVQHFEIDVSDRLVVLTISA